MYRQMTTRRRSASLCAGRWTGGMAVPADGADGVHPKPLTRVRQAKATILIRRLVSGVPQSAMNRGSTSRRRLPHKHARCLLDIASRLRPCWTNARGNCPMTLDGRGDEDIVERAAVGRPKLGQARRVRISTTVEPVKLARLRAYARRQKKSLGQVVDEYVRERFSRSQGASDTPFVARDAGPLSDGS